MLKRSEYETAADSVLFSKTFSRKIADAEIKNTSRMEKHE